MVDLLSTLRGECHLLSELLAETLNEIQEREFIRVGTNLVSLDRLRRRVHILKSAYITTNYDLDYYS